MNTDTTEPRVVKIPQPRGKSWKDFSRDKDEAAIIFLASAEHHRAGYYVVKAKARDEQGRVTDWSLPCAHRNSVAAAQFALDIWGKRCIQGKAVSSDEMLQEYAMAREKGLVKPR